MPDIGKLILFGTGLIGGSFALALKAAGAVGEVVGFGRTRATLETARALGVIDRVGEDLAQELADADLVLLATPVAQMGEIFARLAPHLTPQTVVTDGGSTKSDVLAAARAGLGVKLAQFVPAHPIAGAELSGPAAALPGLYVGKKVVITPLPENTEAALQRVRHAWTVCGAQLHELTPENHDRIFAAVSHLPHLLSFALVHDLAVRPDAALFFEFAASGFRDFTRIAGSHPEMWRDICLANQPALLQELDRYLSQLMALRHALAAHDAASLESVFDLARTARQDWGARQQAVAPSV